MSNKITVADLEAAWIAARDAYDTNDLNYLEWVKSSPVDEIVDDLELYLSNTTWNQKYPLGTKQLNLYVRAKTFVVARDKNVDAALLRKLTFGGAA